MLPPNIHTEFVDVTVDTEDRDGTFLDLPYLVPGLAPGTRALLAGREYVIGTCTLVAGVPGVHLVYEVTPSPHDA